MDISFFDILAYARELVPKNILDGFESTHKDIGEKLKRDILILELIEKSWNKIQLLGKKEELNRLLASANKMGVEELRFQIDRLTNGSFIINEATNIRKIIEGINIDNSMLFKIDPFKFEEVVTELLYAQGFVVERTAKTRDNGYDIIGFKYIENHLPLKFLIECKRYTENKVGIEIIRGFREVLLTEQANRGIIVTTSYFTQGALKKQKENPYLLELCDKDNLLIWVFSYLNKANNP